MRGVRIMVFLIVCMLPACALAQAQSDAAYLRGLPGIRLFIAPLDQYDSADGLTEARIKREVESRLRAAGIKFGNSFGTVLNVFVRATTDLQGNYGFILRLELEEKVFLSRDLSITCPDATTWMHQTLGITDAKRYKSFVLRELAKLTNDFISAYLAVNASTSSFAGGPPQAHLVRGIRRQHGQVAGVQTIGSTGASFSP